MEKGRTTSGWGGEADKLRPKERLGESGRLLDSRGRGELRCPALVKTLWEPLGYGFNVLDSTHPKVKKICCGFRANCINVVGFRGAWTLFVG